MWKTLRSYFHILLYFVTKALHNYCHLLGETKIYCGKYQSFLRVLGTAKTRGNPVGQAEHTEGVKKPPTERATPSLPVQTELNWLLLFPFPIWIWLGPNVWVFYCNVELHAEILVHYEYDELEYLLARRIPFSLPAWADWGLKPNQWRSLAAESLYFIRTLCGHANQPNVSRQNHLIRCCTAVTSSLLIIFWAGGLNGDF